MQERTRDMIGNGISRGIGLAICIGLIYGAMAVIAQVPCWFGHWWPSVVVMDAREAFRDEAQGAFVLTNRKVAQGVAQSPVFYVEATGNSYSPKLGLAVHRCRPDNSRIDEPFGQHALSQTWQTRYCFEMPGTVSANDPLRVTGYLVHRRWFGEVHEPVPEFTIATGM